VRWYDFWCFGKLPGQISGRADFPSRPIPRRYRRDLTPGSTYFFTVVTAERRPLLADPAAYGGPLPKIGSTTLSRFVLAAGLLAVTAFLAPSIGLSAERKGPPACGAVSFRSLPPGMADGEQQSGHDLSYGRPEFPIAPPHLHFRS
jgi:hypothetical protein